MGVILEVRDLWKSLGGYYVLKGVWLKLERGETKVVIGPNGSGKTTLLKCIAGLVKPERGSIIFDGIDITKLDSEELRAVRTRIGFVFQEPVLFPHMTVLDNVLIGLVKGKRVPKNEALKRAAEVLELVGVERSLWGRKPAQLSGGQKQRVAIARALALDPELMVYDEPTTYLDPPAAAEVMNIIERLSRSGVTSIVVTHSLGFALRVASEIIVLDSGRVVEVAKPEEFVSNPKSSTGKALLESYKSLGFL